nr:hypothetical protein [Streptomyces antimycoticus]
MKPQPTPDFAGLVALRRQLDQDLGGAMSPGRTRLTAVLALVLDVAPRAGELVAMRLSHLAPENTAVYVQRRPQHGTGEADDDWFELSEIGRAAVEHWLPLRAQLVERAHGTSKLWVSLHPGHDGVPDARVGPTPLGSAGAPNSDSPWPTAGRAS